ncbi:DUF929 family protein [Intrasporangium sp.]|uniref:DUF929 family protein n=1 Tax=Intrasporangium sp. TaxID=1925024 RepID=UPI00293B33CE|nr:DUF929 family protein [Intrasporangium sp.]MDV3223119.1 DUF929 domain-containing protein [Intrasporangium sp.]
MGKSNRAEVAARAAEMRAAQARKERQQKQMIAAAVAVVVVIIAVAVGVVIANNNDGETPGASDTAFIPKLTSIPAAAFDAAGAPTQANAVPQRVQGGEVLQEDGKPRMIYVGAEFCPYCASERWAMVAALSRFGTFEGLAPTRSATNDGNIPTVTFTGSTYTSDYLSFGAWETRDREFNELQKLPADVDALFKQHNPEGGIPWTFYGTHELPGSGIPLEPLLEHTGDDGWNEIVTQMQTGTSEVGQSINAGANMISAQVCELTGGQPADVCTSPGVTAAAALVQK